MHAIINSTWLACILLATGCGPAVYECAKDREVITRLERCVVVTIPPEARREGNMRFDEIRVEAVPITVLAEKEQVPVEHMAMAHKGKLFCSVECARPTVERKNRAVEEMINAGKQRELKDSLVLDSMRSGLIQ
ncbi:MAG: hypothetical protein JNM31_09910 [Flavobacteriales bacterium]|nr:hypothetical protein [Flavobacteriales bacterium]